MRFVERTPSPTLRPMPMSGVNGLNAKREYYAIFKGRSEKEIWLATSELQKRKSNHQKELKVRAKKLAEFLSTAEAEEVALRLKHRPLVLQPTFRRLIVLLRYFI